MSKFIFIIKDSQSTLTDSVSLTVDAIKEAEKTEEQDELKRLNIILRHASHIAIGKHNESGVLGDFNELTICDRNGDQFKLTIEKVG